MRGYGFRLLFSRSLFGNLYRESPQPFACLVGVFVEYAALCSLKTLMLWFTSSGVLFIGEQPVIGTVCSVSLKDLPEK